MDANRTSPWYLGVSKLHNFKLTWRFDGTLHFIGQNETLAPYREWLRQFFNAAQAENRDAILKGLREAKAGFKW